MSLVGNLEDLPLADILQIVSLSRKSGVLALSRQGVDARLYFRSGLVVAAMVSDFRLDLGGFLTRKGLLTTADVEKLRGRVDGGEALRPMLIGELGIPDKIIDGFSKAGIEKAVYRLFTWAEGAFTFELQEELDESLINPFLPYYEQGINPQFLAMEGARLKDESDYFTTRTEARKAEAQPDAVDEGVGAAPQAEPPAVVPEPGREPAVPPADTASGAPSSRAETEPPVDSQPTAAQAADALPTEPPPPVAVMPPVEEESGQVSVVPEAVREASAPVGARPLVVLVDNDVVALRNIEAALVQAGYEVAPFNRVDAVVKAVRELLRKGRPLLLLVDLVMPKRDASGMLGGLEVLELLRGEEQHVPMVMLADLENKEAEERAQELAVDGYLRKPGRKTYVRGENTTPDFLAFISALKKEVERVAPRAAVISASSSADPFVDLGSELKGELEAATVAISASAPAGLGAPVEKSRGLDQLKEMVRELNDPHFNADVSLLILRFAVELMGRAVIFVVTNEEVLGLGQAGIERSDATQAVRALRIPINEPSIFADVLSHRTAIRRKLDSTPWNRKLLETLGGIEPSESFAAPVFTSRRIAAIVYGDNGAENKPVGDVDAFEIFLSHAGIAMERSLLERRLRDLTSGR